MRRCSLVAFLLIFFFCQIAKSDIRIEVSHSASGEGFDFKSGTTPASNDAATMAIFSVLGGVADPNSGDLRVLHDGRLPVGEDQPAENFFFRAGSDGGRILIDLGRVISIKQFNSYSGHPNTRAPQIYRLYATDGTGDGFVAEPRNAVDPTTCGWKLVANVDTQPRQQNQGGHYGVGITDSAGELGKFRYLLMDIAKTRGNDPFGNTFFCEIDVIDAEGPAPIPIGITEAKPILKKFDAEDGKYRFTIDATDAPELADWSETELKPVVQQWYPKLVAMLPSEGFSAPTNVTLRFRNDMGGTPASAGGSGINLNAGWFRRELKREALGAVVHEMVHVVQSYGRARGVPRASRPPGWLVEGIADYIRWFLYEPQSRGAEITSRNLARAKYDASYRVTGNFLDWVTQHHDKEIVRKLNAAAREGRYSEQLWKDATGKSVQELGDEWKKFHTERLEVK